MSSVGEPVRVAIVSGVCMRHDAISNAMLEQRRALLAAGCEVTVFVRSTDCLVHPDVVLVPDAWALEIDGEYASADVVIIHFGVHHPLFSSLLLGHAGRRVVHFHNVTPPELLDGASRALAHDSLLQLSIADRADEIWTVSPFNADVLREWCDTEPPPVVPMPLAVGAADQPVRREPGGLSDGAEVVVLGVGRFVRSKGTLELVDALRRVPEDLGPVHLVLAGSSRFSDPDYLGRVHDAIVSLPSHVTAELLTDLSDEALVARYERADVFATASHHEGFCVPVIEALAAGCGVVVTDAGALPDTVGTRGRVVPLGDGNALTAAMVEAIDERRRGAGRWVQGSAGDRWHEQLLDHLRPNTSDSVDARLIEAVRRLAAGSEPSGNIG